MGCRTDIRIADAPFDPESELAAFRSGLANAGGMVSFLGLVRGRAGEADVTALHLQHYPGMTEKGIAAFATEAAERWPLEALLVIHRVGAMAPGEPIVLVATASAHRRAAFEAADFLMDYLKSRAMFWKREERPDGSEWIEPRDEDYSDAERWS